MGQRSQIYIRYNNAETLVAKHLQWNWGTYMIARAYQLLDFISKNVESSYSNFLSEKFDIANHGEDREDLKILDSLISLNSEIGSYVQNIDLIEENYIYRFHSDNDISFKLNPEKEDNNDGIFVIDVNENKDGTIKIKYGFSTGYGNNFKMCSALNYLKAYKEELEYMLKHCKTEEDKQELLDDWKKYIKKAKEIDKRYVQLSQEEYIDIFNKTYFYNICIKEERLKEMKLEREKIIKKDCKYDEIINKALESTQSGNYIIDLKNEYGLNEFEIQNFKSLLNQDTRVANVEWSGNEADIIFYLENCPNAEDDEEEYEER